MTERDPATVLVVDDEPDVADSYADQLVDHHDPRTAYSGAEAKAKLTPAVDVVLLDRRMPGMSGDDVLAYMREQDIEVRVAMVTAIDPDFDIIDLPFDDYVVKPVTRAELLDTIDRMLTCAEYEQRLQEYYSLTVKYITLKQTKTSVELADSDEFDELKRRREAVETALDEQTAAFEEQEFITIIRSLEDRYRTFPDA
jgi:DNA-binding response OmpR family regulator